MVFVATEVLFPSPFLTASTVLPLLAFPVVTNHCSLQFYICSQLAGLNTLSTVLVCTYNKETL